jgi:hypothetical protein
MALAREKREERKRDEDADTIGTSKKKVILQVQVHHIYIQSICDLPARCKHAR